MIHTAAIAGLLIGFLRGGKLRNLASHHLRIIPVLFLSFICEAVVVFGLVEKIAGSEAATDVLRTVVATAQYILVISFLLVNASANIELKAKVSLYLIAAGSAANALVIIANQGQMPISLLLTDKIDALKNVPLDRIAAASHYTLASADTVLIRLGDWLPVWSFGWYIVSPGDFFISAGLAIFAYWLTQNPDEQKLNNLEHPENIVYTNGR